MSVVQYIKSKQMEIKREMINCNRRLAPLGQDKEEEEAEIERADLASKVFSPFSSMHSRSELFAQVRKMEEEQEEMGNSLMALTSHYAKVQLRLQQVVSAPVDSREELLKDLHSFASMGIPDLRGRGGGLGNASRDSEETQEAAVAEQGRKQAAAIAQLRAQLEELENYAYQVD